MSWILFVFLILVGVGISICGWISYEKLWRKFKKTTSELDDKETKQVLPLALVNGIGINLIVVPIILKFTQGF